MSGFLGQIPEEVDELAGLLERKASEIETTVSEISSKLGSTTWRGNDRERFEGTWQGTIAANLRSAANQLTDAAQDARRNAAEQRNASA